MNKHKEIGNNGVPFGPGYKGPGMCEACHMSRETKIVPGVKLICGYYGKACYLVSRNCSGIKIFNPKK